MPPWNETQLRLLMASLCAALFIMGLDVGVVNVILPELQNVFGTTVSRAMMLATVYMTAMAAFQLTFGRLADLIDPVVVFLGGIICFFLGSLGCVLSGSITHLLIGRGVQGLGGAMLGASFGAIVLRMVPREKTGAVIGLMTMIMSLGSIVGPPLGGFLAQYLSWHWVFAINLPICILAALPLIVLLRSAQGLQSKPPLEVKRLDLPGSVYSICMFASLPLAFGQAANKGWTSNIVWIFLAVFVVSTVLFVFRQRRARHPLLRLAVLTDSGVAMIIVVKILIFMAINAVMLVYPFFMVKRLGLDVSQTGVMMLACAVSMAVLTPLSGKMTDRFGSGRVMFSGALVLAILGIGMVFGSLNADRVLTFVSLAFFGVCFAGLTIASTVYLLRQAPRGEEGMFSGINSLLMPVSGSLGLAVFSYIYALGEATRDTMSDGSLAGFQASMAVVFVMGMVLLALIRFGQFKKQGI
jgi:EmrB/QacA subfamily drug resistance transporter